MNRRTGYSFDTIFAIALFCLFTVTALLLAVFGSRVYQNTRKTLDAEQTLRTTLSYLSGKLSSDSSADVALSDNENVPVLRISSSSSDSDYETCIWFCDGQLFETLVPAGTDPLKTGGTPILLLDDLHFTLENRRLTVYARTGEYDRTAVYAVNRFFYEEDSV